MVGTLMWSRSMVSAAPVPPPRAVEDDVIECESEIRLDVIGAEFHADGIAAGQLAYAVTESTTVINTVQVGEGWR